MSQNNLEYYANCVETDNNEIKAFGWYFESTESGNAVAQNILKDYYGKGINRNETKAFERYLKSTKVRSAKYRKVCYGIRIDKNNYKEIKKT
jgi:TPR repeat protein